MKILSGKIISEEIRNELKKEVDNLSTEGIKVTLAVILVGDDPASHVYVSHKEKGCAAMGVQSIVERLPEETTEEDLLRLVQDLNERKDIDGILCQVPLPPQIDPQKVIEMIDPMKDVDCFHPYNLGLLTAGAPRFMPCTPFGVLQILKRSGYSTSGKNVVILGRSNIVGRPLSILLSLKGWDATVTLCHSRTKNIEKICRSADILVAAIGIPHFVSDDFVKKNAVVIDVGVNRIDDPNHPKGTRLVGDVDFEAIKEIAEAATPVPGGVGPMTISMLLYNTINAARLRNGKTTFEL